MKRCKACGIACRPNTRKTVYMVNGAAAPSLLTGRLVRALICAACAKGTIPILLAQPKLDPRVCVECKKQPAKLCESCNLRSRTAAARQALVDWSKDGSVQASRETPLELEPKEDL